MRGNIRVTGTVASAASLAEKPGARRFNGRAALADLVRLSCPVDIDRKPSFRETPNPSVGALTDGLAPGKTARDLGGWEPGSGRLPGGEERYGHDHGHCPGSRKELSTEAAHRVGRWSRGRRCRDARP